MTLTFAVFTPLSSLKDFPSIWSIKLERFKLSEYFRFQKEMQYHRNIPLIQQGLYNDDKVQHYLFSSYFIVHIFRLAFVFQMQC